MSISEPDKITTPWASTGSKNPIPANASNTTGAAGFDKGFPDITMTPEEAGGIPPAGQDFNGILYQITDIIRYMQAGGQTTFSSDLAAAIGGYPKGSFVLADDGLTIWQSQVDSNSTNPNTTPATWHPIDVGLRSDLAEPNGVLLVNGAINSSDPIGNGYKSTNHYGAVIVGDNPLGSPGDDFPLPDSLRDAINVSRKISGEPTNCHAFADKTIIESPSDYGGYGAFDATTIIKGPNNQDHAAAFQARLKYDGTGSIEWLWGLIVTPTATSTGTIKKNIAIDITGVVTTTAVVERFIGVNITPTETTTENIGVKVSDSAVGSSSLSPSTSFLSLQGASGYSFAGSGGGFLYNSGSGGFGFDPKAQPSYRLGASDDGGVTVCGIGASAFTGAYLATPSDTEMAFYSGGSKRLSVLNSTNSSSVSPGSDNSQPLGSASKRWSVVYAGTGAINTCDANEKTTPKHISDTMMDAADEISIGVWQWLDSIARKGEGAARWHFGPIAQQVRDAFEKHGLDGCDYGLLCYDEWGDEFEPIMQDSYDDNGAALKIPTGELRQVQWKGERWGVRPDQCLWLIAAASRRRADRAEKRILDIESRLKSAGI